MSVKIEELNEAPKGARGSWNIEQIKAELTSAIEQAKKHGKKAIQFSLASAWKEYRSEHSEFNPKNKSEKSNKAYQTKRAIEDALGDDSLTVGTKTVQSKQGKKVLVVYISWD